MSKALEILHKFKGHNIEKSLRDVGSSRSSRSKLDWFVISEAEKGFYTKFFEFIDENFFDVIFVKDYHCEYSSAIWLNNRDDLYNGYYDLHSHLAIEAKFYHNEIDFDTVFIGFNRASELSSLGTIVNKFKNYTGGKEYHVYRFVQECRNFLKQEQ